MRLSSDGSDGGHKEERVRDLLCGLGPKYIHLLCSSPMHEKGGFGFTPQQVGDMTLDQIFMLLADRKILRAGSKERTMSLKEFAPSDEVKGRAADGTPIVGRIRGKSVARELAERKAACEQATKQRGRKKTRG